MPRSRFRNANAFDVHPLGAAALVILLATIAIAFVVVRPFFSRPADQSASAVEARDAKKAADAFDRKLQRQVAMIDGRSLFSIPPRPNEEPKGPVSPTYAGPQLIAYVNGTAWFADGQKLSAESPRSGSLELVRADPPWSIRVKWRNGEYDVELFKKVPLAALGTTSRPDKSLWSTVPARSLNGSGSATTQSGPPTLSITAPVPANLTPPPAPEMARPEANPVRSQPMPNGSPSDPAPAQPGTDPASPAPPAPANPSPEPQDDPAPAPAPPPSEPSEP